jgi:hypothetical protein
MADTDTARALHSTVLKGKAIPLQAWTDLESSRRLRFLDFKTIAKKWYGYQP